jgi:hypothetical protein
MNGTPECSFVAGHKAGWRFQTYTIAVAASGASRKVKATVRLSAPTGPDSTADAASAARQVRDLRTEAFLFIYISLGGIALANCVVTIPSAHRGVMRAA